MFFSLCCRFGRVGGHFVKTKKKYEIDEAFDSVTWYTGRAECLISHFSPPWHHRRIISNESFLYISPCIFRSFFTVYSKKRLKRHDSSFYLLSKPVERQTNNFNFISEKITNVYMFRLFTYEKMKKFSPLNLLFSPVIPQNRYDFLLVLRRNYAREWERKQNAAIIWGLLCFFRVRISLSIIDFMTNWISSGRDFFFQFHWAF